jgi:hypothetical protein
MHEGEAADWRRHAAADLRHARLGQADPKVLEGLMAFHTQRAGQRP